MRSRLESDIVRYVSPGEGCNSMKYAADLGDVQNIFMEPYR